MPFELMCEVCKTNIAQGVYCSSFGPISFAYCTDCGLSGAEPYGVLLGIAAMQQLDGNEILGLEHTIEATLSRVGKTKEDFKRDVDTMAKDMSEDPNGPYSKRGSDVNN